MTRQKAPKINSVCFCSEPRQPIFIKTECAEYNDFIKLEKLQ